MNRLLIGLATVSLLSTAALAQNVQMAPFKSIVPYRFDPAVMNDATKGSKVSPIPAPDASTQKGQEIGNAKIVRHSQNLNMGI